MCIPGLKSGLVVVGSKSYFYIGDVIEYSTQFFAVLKSLSTSCYLFQIQQLYHAFKYFLHLSLSRGTTGRGSSKESLQA